MVFDFNLLLVDSSIYDHSKKVSENNQNEKISYYINDTLGWSYLDDYFHTSTGWEKLSNDIRNYNVKTSTEVKDEIRNIFKSLDEIIDIDFLEMLDNNGSELDIYSVSYSSNFETNAIGQAIAQESKNGSWWDIIWKKTNSSEILSQSDKNTIIHELGHTLGLSHPNNDPFNKRWTTSETVMSYNIGSDGWDTWYSEADIDALISIWGRENDDGIINFRNKSEAYKIRRTGLNKYAVKSNIGLEDITGMDEIIFTDKIFNIEEDIASVFNLIEEVDDITGKIYRLYRATFGRFPDIEGYRYWIEKPTSREDNYKNICQSFIQSNEFEEIYSNDNSNEKYIKNLYANILERPHDQMGFEYWIDQLNYGFESKSEILMGFAESEENKTLFIEETAIEII